MSFDLALLGTPVAWRREDGRGVEVVWRLRRALQAVAYLALREHRRADKDELIEAVWPNESAGSIQRNFHPTISDARRSLGRSDAILRRHRAYLLNPEIEWDVDVERFRRLAVLGREQITTAPRVAYDAWRAAWRLCRGPFLAGVETPWAAELRETLREEYLALLAGLGALAVELGERTVALDAYRSVILEDPYEERVHRAVMELYGQDGRRDLVSRQYVRLQELLKELGVEPLEETQECYQRLMR